MQVAVCLESRAVPPFPSAYVGNFAGNSHVRLQSLSLRNARLKGGAGLEHHPGQGSLQLGGGAEGGSARRGFL